MRGQRHSNKKKPLGRQFREEAAAVNTACDADYDRHHKARLADVNDILVEAAATLREDLEKAIEDAKRFAGSRLNKGGKFEIAIPYRNDAERVDIGELERFTPHKYKKNGVAVLLEACEAEDVSITAKNGHVTQMPKRADGKRGTRPQQIPALILEVDWNKPFNGLEHDDPVWRKLDTKPGGHTPRR